MSERKFKAGETVRHKAGGQIMVVIDYSWERGRDFKCAWMDGHIRRVDEFAQAELEKHDPTTIDVEATEVLPIRLLPERH